MVSTLLIAGLRKFVSPVHAIFQVWPWVIAIQLGAIYHAIYKKRAAGEAALSIQYLDFEVVEVDPLIPLVFDPVVWPGA